MNATPAIFRPQSDDAGQSNARAPTPAASDQANTRDFAGALSDAGAKPVRAPRGRHLPGSGNQSPPAAGTAAPVAVATPGARSDVPAVTQPSTAPTSALAGAAVGAAAGATPQISQAMTQLTPKVAGDALPADTGVADAAAIPSPPALSAIDAPDTALSVGPGSLPNGPPVEIPLTERDSAAHSAPPAQANAVKPAVNLPAGKAAIAAATSGKIPGANTASDSDATSAAPSASADADASAQAAPAALAQNIRAPEADSSNPFDDLATADAGIAAPEFGAADALPAAPPVPGVARATAASIAAAVTAATKASVTLAVSLAAGTGALDKHARDSNADTLLSAASSDGSAGAAQLLAPTPTSETTPAPTLKVAAGVDSGEFGQGVADRVSLMMDSNLTSAKLQVNPPALGPIEVRIALQGGHAQVWFSSHSAVTRDALESSAPKLREMLGAQGFGQVSVDISQRSFQERSPTPRGYETTAAIGMDTSSPAAATGMARAANGLLDAYA